MKSMRNFMKFFWVVMIVLGMAADFVNAQYVTRFHITDMDNETLKTKVNQNITNLLTTFNSLQGSGAELNFHGVDITPEALNNVITLWKDCAFRCAETDVIERCLSTSDNNYQVRNIPIIMVPKDSTDVIEDKLREGVVTFDNNGVITDFHFAIDVNMYSNILKNAKGVEDFVQRQLILEYVERFRNSYNLKDINFLQQIFSDDALIITGKVITTKKSDVNMGGLDNKKIIYSKQSKKEYLTKLERIFKLNKRINVTFDEIKVVRHPAKADFYGVTLKQGYSSDYYHDEGYLFLLWDFTNKEAPQIHVRTWQPDKIDENTKLPEDEIFEINDFDI